MSVPCGFFFGRAFDGGIDCGGIKADRIADTRRGYFPLIRHVVDVLGRHGVAARDLLSFDEDRVAHFEPPFPGKSPRLT